MSDVNGGGASASWGSRARCRPCRSPAREEECPWHRTIRKIPRRALASGNHICSPCAKCQPRYLNHPVKSSQQVWVYHPHFVDKKMEAHGKSCPKSPNPRAGTGATPAPSALCRLRPQSFRSPPKLDAFSSPSAHRNLFYFAWWVTSPGLANSFCSGRARPSLCCVNLFAARRAPRVRCSRPGAHSSGRAEPSLTTTAWRSAARSAGSNRHLRRGGRGPLRLPSPPCRFRAPADRGPAWAPIGALE